VNKKIVIGLGLLVVLVGGYFGATKYVSNVAAKKVDDVVVKMSGNVDIRYKDVTANLFNKQVVISDVTVAPVGSTEKTHIAKITISGIDTDSATPAFLQMSVDGIEVNLATLGEDAKALTDLGYTDKIVCDFSMDYAFNKEKRELNIKNISLGAKDAGEINVSMRLGNVSLDPKEAAGLLFTYPKVILYDLKVTYTDASLVGRIMQSEAKKQQKDVAEVKKNLIADIDAAIASQQDDFAKSALTAVKQFINAPKMLSISATPEKPVLLERLMRAGSPKETIDLLHLQVKS